MAADIKTETVTYTAGGAGLVGYLAWDASQPGPRPGIVVFSEWWGVTEYLKRRARQLAELGYVALVASMSANRPFISCPASVASAAVLPPPYMSAASAT